MTSDVCCRGFIDKGQDVSQNKNMDRWLLLKKTRGSKSCLLKKDKGSMFFPVYKKNICNLHLLFLLHYYFWLRRLLPPDPTTIISKGIRTPAPSPGLSVSVSVVHCKAQPLPSLLLSFLKEYQKEVICFLELRLWKAEMEKWDDNSDSRTRTECRPNIGSLAHLQCQSGEYFWDSFGMKWQVKDVQIAW